MADPTCYYIHQGPILTQTVVYPLCDQAFIDSCQVARLRKGPSPEMMAAHIAVFFLKEEVRSRPSCRLRSCSLMTMHGAYCMPQKPIAQRIKRLRRQERKDFLPKQKSTPRTISPCRIFPHPRLGQLLLHNAISFRCRPISSSPLQLMDMFIYPHIHIFIYLHTRISILYGFIRRRKLR